MTVGYVKPLNGIVYATHIPNSMVLVYVRNFSVLDTCTTMYYHVLVKPNKKKQKKKKQKKNDVVYYRIRTGERLLLREPA